MPMPQRKLGRKVGIAIRITRYWERRYESDFFNNWLFRSSILTLASGSNYLHRFLIDKSFVKNMFENGNNLTITKVIIGLGYTLGLRVVAEGVERVEGMRISSQVGCRTIYSENRCL